MDRRITGSDLQALQQWIAHSPRVPAGKWYKDFGTFKLCGEGGTPLTFLEQGQVPFGEEVE
jgi:hypothetical protein